MMVSLTLTIEKQTLKKMEHFGWVNWSEVAREEILKKEMFERYLKTRKITADDWRLCEKIDWHPVDELPLKKEFVKRLKRISKQPSKKISSKDFEDWCEKL